MSTVDSEKISKLAELIEFDGLNRESMLAHIKAQEKMDTEEAKKLRDAVFKWYDQQYGFCAA